MAQLAVFSDIINSLKAIDLRPVDLSALVMIKEHNNIRQNAIGEKLKMQKPNVVSLIDSLQNRGLISRIQDNKDRRANILCLTENGEKLLAKGIEAQEKHHLRQIEKLKNLDLDNFTKCLKALGTMEKTI
ncbi:MAG: MarR family transcriptional regulator [Caulobacterales bacterium]|nr:MarR family transcriptional regulator [Caulobacterales bacterium]